MSPAEEGNLHLNLLKCGTLLEQLPRENKAHGTDDTCMAMTRLPVVKGELIDFHTVKGEINNSQLVEWMKERRQFGEASTSQIVRADACGEHFQHGTEPSCTVTNNLLQDRAWHAFVHDLDLLQP